MPSGPSSPRSASPFRAEKSSAIRPDALLSSAASFEPLGDFGDDGQPSSARLSLNHLKQGESHQRIRHGAQQLLRLTESFSGYNGPGLDGGYETANDQSLPSDSDIRAMTRLSHGIARDISEIMALRKDDPRAHKRKGSSGIGGGGTAIQLQQQQFHHQQQHQQQQQQHQQQQQYRQHNPHPGPAANYTAFTDYASTAGRTKTRRKVEFSCHKCHRVDTPEWRPGPDGPSTLCNVCGLIYAKRERKKEESTVPTFGSTKFS